MAIYALGAWVLFLPLGILDASRIPAEVSSSCGCSDNGQQVWLLAVAHARLASGHFPFFTTAVNYPAGVNLTNSASFPLLATLASPLTGLIGPVGSYDLLIRLSLVVSASACYFVLRRLGLRSVAAGVGGAVYAFSPLLVRETEAHLFVAFAPLPPIILLVVYRRLRGDVGRPFRGGLLLGLLLAIQGLISIEVMAFTAVAVVSVLILVAAGRTVLRRPLRPGATRLGWLALGAGLIAIPILAYPTWYQLYGPGHITGPPSPVGAFALAPLTTLFPNASTIVAGQWSGWRTQSQGFTDTFAFVGLPLLVVVGWLLVRHRRHPLVVPAVLLGAVAWILALGPRIRIGHGHGEVKIPLPFAVLDHLPLVQSIVPNRLVLYLDLALAVLTAVAIDRLLESGRERRVPSLIGTAAVVASAALLMPAGAVPLAGVAGAQQFRSDSGRRSVPSGAVVVAYPYPRFGWADAQLWQAESGLRFSLIGGYAERPLTARDIATNRYLGPSSDRIGHGTKAPATLLPAAISRLYLHAAAVGSSGVRRAERALPQFVARYGATAAMVLSTAPGAERVVRALTAVFGAPEAKVGAVLIWPALRAGS